MWAMKVQTVIPSAADSGKYMSGWQPRSGDRQVEANGCGSRRNHGLSPLQGSGKKPCPVPGADAPGYESDAPSGLFTGQGRTGLSPSVNHG